MTLMQDVADVRESMIRMSEHAVALAKHARRSDAALARIGRLLKGLADRLEDHERRIQSLEERA
ncbi:MAG: hypothetical protein HYZ28_02115 [Myxococcales bacterium]|nr:hypothetical protein [Myxococcales bacterium]